MANSNLFTYIKRSYFLPFKPLLDREYKKFGYKICEIKKKKNSLLNIVYYVRPKDFPSNPKISTLYKINFLLSLYRSIVFPLLLPLLIISFILLIFIQNVGFLFSLPVITSWLIIFGVPITIASVILSNVAENIIKKENLIQKMEAKLKSKGLSAWYSYKDNDSKFCPPSGQVISSKTAIRKKTSNVSQKNMPDLSLHFKEIREDDEKGTITLSSGNGEEIEFLEMAAIVYQNNFYEVLEPIEGKVQSGALVFKVTKDATGEYDYELIFDKKIENAVIAEWRRLSEEQGL